MAELMKTVLSEKLEPLAHRAGLQELESDLGEISSGLHIQIGKIEAGAGGWISIDYDGEDSEVFTEILKSHYGLAPVQFSNMELGDTYRGFIVNSGEVGYGLYLDLGILSPQRVDGLYPLHRMRAQLADGWGQSLRQIARRFCLHDGLPLKVRIEGFENAGKVTLALTDRQESYFKDWERYPFDRLVVLGSTINSVHRAIERTGLAKDIVRVERLSLASTILICKLGTQAPGVISELGPHLAATKLYSYIPKARSKT
jgi:hypothetical protein